MEQRFHERWWHQAQTVAFEPFALYLDGIDANKLNLRQVVYGFLLIVFLITLGLTMIGLEDSHGLSLAQEFIAWSVHSVAGVGPIALATRFFRRLHMSRLVSSIWALLIATPVLALASMNIDAYFGILELDTDPSSGFLLRWLSEIVQVFPAAIVVWVIVGSLLLTRSTAVATGHPDSETEDLASWPQYLNEVPEDKRGAIIAMTADQHYLRVYTTAGESYVRGALREAIDSLGHLDGLHIHRSHWVAKDHVIDLTKTQQGMYCVMSNNQQFPVSRRRKHQTRVALSGFPRKSLVRKTG